MEDDQYHEVCKMYIKIPPAIPTFNDSMLPAMGMEIDVHA